jgi:hypothetical protein
LLIHSVKLLQKIRESGVITIIYRDASFPFSYGGQPRRSKMLHGNGAPTRASVDL